MNERKKGRKKEKRERENEKRNERKNAKERQITGSKSDHLQSDGWQR